MLEKFYYKNSLIAIRITRFSKGSVPHTEPQEPLGLLTLGHPKGSYLKAHIHRPKKRITNQRLQECFVVKKGKVRVDLYGPDKKFFKYLYLKQGQALLTVNGGHGFHILEDCEIFEVKNGPYIEDKDFIEVSEHKT